MLTLDATHKFNIETWNLFLIFNTWNALQQKYLSIHTICSSFYSFSLFSLGRSLQLRILKPTNRESWHSLVILLIFSIHLSHILIAEFLLRFMIVSSIIILPLVLEKLTAGRNSPFDRILFGILKIHSIVARQGEYGGRKWSGISMLCAALFTIRDEWSGYCLVIL